LTRSRTIYLALTAILLTIPLSHLRAQKSDSLFVSVEPAKKGKVRQTPKEEEYHSPRKAALYSAVLPGLGQIYNRKYWKVPIVYAGYGTLGYFIYFNQTNYIKYRDAYIDFTDENPLTDSYYSLISGAMDKQMYDKEHYPRSYDPEYYEWVKGQLKNGMDYYKRYRDLSLIGMAGWYVLTILDAVVDAQLFHFDVTPDLTVHLLPAVQPHAGLPPAMGVTLGLTF